MPAAPAEPYRIRCAEILGGILAINADVITKGLSASLFSTAHDGDRGGDLYYVSVCAWDRLTRIAVADVRGHGGQASRISAWFYEAMKKRMNTTSGNILSDLNGVVRDRGFDAITTAAIVGYHVNKRRLYFSYAGHPPVYVQHAEGPWQPVTLPSAKPLFAPGPANLPLGAFLKVKYDLEHIKMQPGDRICLYTDGITDCSGPDGEPFGDTGLLDSLNRNVKLSPAELKIAVLADFQRHRGECPLDDDVTLLIAEVS
jgi:sigma-B regulation protein RsbU (phosphoserine phosphatase)